MKCATSAWSRWMVCRPPFQVRPGCGLDTTAGGYFLTVDGQGKTNFTGSLPQVFSCMVVLGTGGCGYEHQLQSLRGAIANPPVNVENRGFVRDDARLGIVILSDEDFKPITFMKRLGCNAIHCCTL